MQDGTGELTIVFNGEIYNSEDLRHELEAGGHFRSRPTPKYTRGVSRWGVDSLSGCNGMFAFALLTPHEARCSWRVTGR